MTGARSPALVVRDARLALLRALWVAAAALALGLFAAGVPARHAQLLLAGAEVRPALLDLGLSLAFYAAYFTALDLLLVATHFAVAAVIFWRRSDEWMALFVALTLVTAPLSFIRALGDHGAGLRALTGLVNYTGLVASLTLLYTFPDGRFVPRWTRPLAGLWAALNLPVLLHPAWPLGLSAWPVALQIPILVGWTASGVAAQFARYRRVSDPAQRQQTKWALLGLTAAALGPLGYYLPFVALPSLAEASLPGLYYQLAGPTVFALSLLLRLAAVTGFTLVMLLFPLSFAVAILRYRLWDIDLLLNRSLVYGTVTGALALVYVALVLVLQGLFRPLAVRYQPELVTAISTLAIAALFAPMRRWAQTGIDRRFYRRKFDAERILARFSRAARDEVDVAQLAEALLGAAAEALQPAGAGVWLRRDAVGWERGAAAYAQNRPFPVALTAIGPGDLALPVLRAAHSGVEVEALPVGSPGGRLLREAGAQLAVPLLSQGELVGVLHLGPRLGRQGYSTEDRRWLGQLAAQAASAVRVAQLVEVEQELRVAQLVQQMLLPAGLPIPPGWDLSARYLPARSVGGDFFDLVPLPDGRLALAVGDVTDKGVPAALVMAATRSILRAASQTHREPGRVLAQANDLLCPDMLPKMFVTCLYAVLEPGSGRLRFANAGHCLPYCRRAGAAVELRATGMPLGLLPGMQYEENEVTLAPGECVLFYSDGLIEAHNAAREMFGKGRLSALVSGSALKGSSGLADCLLEAVRAHAAPNADQEDDVTLLTLERLPAGTAP